MTSPIGIFDSGLGGLTVLREVMQTFPRENFLYFGDTARVPYGEKSQETVIRYSLEIGRYLTSQKIKLLIVACNTASAFAVEDLRRELSIPVVDVIEPAAQEIAKRSSIKHIAVLGTKATIRSGVYQKRISECLPQVRLTTLACPLFVPLVEEHFQDHPATKMIIEEYLKPLIDENVDALILGCTHYPLLVDVIRDVLGQDVEIIDSASACARRVASVLESSMLKFSLSDKVKIKYFVSDDPETFRKFGEQFLGKPIEIVEKVVPEFL